MQTSLASFGTLIISLSLNGDFNFFSNYENVDFPDNKVYGHQSKVIYIGSFEGELLSIDDKGKLCFYLNSVIWKDKKAQKLSTENIDKNIQVATSNETCAFLIDIAGKLYIVDLKSGQAEKGDSIYLLTEKGNIVFISNGIISKQYKTEINATSFNLNSTFSQAVIGEKVFLFIKNGFIHLFDFEQAQVVWKAANFGSKITSLEFSPNDEFLILGDSTRKIRLWNMNSKSVATDEWIYHSMMVFFVTFNSNGKFALSASQDGKVYIWNVETLKKELEIETEHKDGVLFAKFIDHNQIVTSGGDNLIKRFKTSEDYF